MKKYAAYTTGLLAALFFSCGSDEKAEKNPPAGVICDSLFSDKTRDLRMVSFGDLRENIPIGDGPTVIENEADRLVEKIELNDADSTYAEVYYIFRENRLCEAEINIITKSNSVLESVTDSITGILTRSYGKPVREGGFHFWSGKTTGGYRVEIYLSNRTDEFQSPTLQITYRAELIETPRMAFAY